ncbi:DUF2071 domain-containing protein [Cytophagaceae bacterium YF14B1]|uniref:DUF2071 domain-containing protein n=1 Tax=Xanthocytophaga flava TaxID=3048013 RepID=A0AAE3QLS7_9BACT|nr:DUF2071 domain-containing protein [Xanthocytophaga flavus]MDJ1481672.1 DUF2071 domain-containing protein [Xanthocytophaga flavus]
MNVFLTAEWKHLINLTYEVEPSLLEEYLPKGIEVDTALNGKAHVSLVAFDFLNTRVKGISIPFHVNFPEINLRFYVRYKGQVGVVFIREFVPKYCIALVANRIYNEPYLATSMTSSLQITNDEVTSHHQFKYKGQIFDIQTTGTNSLFTPEETTTENYFKEHTWGFGTAHSGKTKCYKVEHPVWRIYPFKNFELRIEFGKLYGKKWEFLGHTQPTYKVFAEGSAVKVFGALTLTEFDKLYSQSV